MNILFSASRVRSSSKVSPDVINGSKVSVWMDETNQQIVMTLKGKLIQAYQDIGSAIAQQGTIQLDGVVLGNAGKI